MSSSHVVDPGIERRALLWLLFAFGFHVVYSLTLRAYPIELGGPAWLFVYRASWTLRDIMIIGGVASLFGAYRSRLALAALIACISLFVLEQVAPMVMRFDGIEPRTSAQVVKIGIGATWLLAYTCLVWLVARATVGFGPKVVAAIATLMIVAGRLVRWFGDRDTLSEQVEYVVHLVPMVLVLVLFAWRIAALPRSGRARPDPGAAWQDAVDGVRRVRTAIVGQLVLTLGLLLVAFLVRGSPIFAIVLVVGGAVAALVFAFMTVSGLGRLRRIPAAADANGPFSAAWGLAVTGIALVLGVTTFFVLGVATEAMALHHYARFMAPVQVTAGLVGLGMSVALYHGARRVGRALDAPGLATQATVTIVIGVLLQLVGQLLQDKDVVRELFERPKSITIAVVATTVIGGVVSIVMTLMTLGSLERTLAQRAATTTWDG